MKHERLYEFRLLRLQPPRQPADDRRELPRMSAAQKVRLEARLAQPRCERGAVRRRLRSQRIHHRSEAAAIEPYSQLDQALLGAADVELGDAKC